jgi:uncharacterized protein (TIGR02118 family)
MYKLTAMYRRVDDEEKLEEFFSTIHLPHAEKLPGLLGSEVCRIDGKPGGPSRFHLTYSLYFSSKDALYSALRSQPGIQFLSVLHEWLEAGVISWFHGEALADRHTTQATWQ